MTPDWYRSFVDELTKISVALNEDEKRRQALQFLGLGMATVPAVSSAVSKIQTGRWIPQGAKSPKRWLAGALAQGAFWGGALPAVQHMVARSNLAKAESRRAAEKDLQRLAPEGVHQALKPTGLKVQPPSLPGASS